MRENAKGAVAVGSANASAVAKQYRLAQSRALALAAASGGSAVDPTVVKIMADLASAGSTATRVQVFNAEEQARGMRNQAAATEYGGELAKQAGKRKALFTVLSGAKSIYDMTSSGAGSDFYSGSIPDTPDFDWHNIGSGGGYISGGQY
jgi:hypothetical protein